MSFIITYQRSLQQLSTGEAGDVFNMSSKQLIDMQLGVQ